MPNNQNLPDDQMIIKKPSPLKCRKSPNSSSEGAKGKSPNSSSDGTKGKLQNSPSGGGTKTKSSNSSSGGAKEKSQVSDSGDNKKVSFSPPKDQSEDGSTYNHANYGMFQVFDIEGDGNCLFRCMAHYAFGTQEDHLLVRQFLINHVCRNWDFFRSFAPHKDQQEQHKYKSRMEQDGVYGSEMEIVAFTRVFQCKVEVFFKSAPERDPLVYGTRGESCPVLYSGASDAGHYDVLEPTSPNALQSHTEAVTLLRSRVTAEIEEACNDNPNSSRLGFRESVEMIKDMIKKKAPSE